MNADLSLLDTPKKRSLQIRSTELRAKLKDYERAFAEDHNGSKPTQDDIKADGDIASLYKAYTKLRDVIRGKISYEEFEGLNRVSLHGTSHKRADSGISFTPQKRQHPNTYDPYDVPNTKSPRPLVLSAIGPTPQRDGRVLGLFDLPSMSARDSQTPSSSTKRRKVESELRQSPRTTSLSICAQTPNRKPRNNAPDLLDHLTGTPNPTPQTGRRNNSRTPVSEGRKFMLSQFFATPSSKRFSAPELSQSSMSQTPLRDRVLVNPGACNLGSQVPLDATPAYLKRTTTFKDRLMSASRTSENSLRLEDKSAIKNSAPTLLQFKAGPKPLSQIVSDLRDLEYGDHDDDLEALKEVEQSALNSLPTETPTDKPDQSPMVDENQNPHKVWKKRGQKRTTRKSNIRPAIAKIAAAPNFVIDEDDEEDYLYEVDESGEHDIDDSVDIDDKCADGSKQAKKHSRLTKVRLKAPTMASEARTKADANKPIAAGARTFNPNAQSHMNFRSLKIRNKNSKAGKGMKGRFGRRR